MNEVVEFYTTALPKGPHHQERLRTEIAWLEARLHELGQPGDNDSAYERKLARTYKALLGVRRGELGACAAAS